MMECKNFMCNSMDPITVSLLSSLFFLFCCGASHQVRCFAFVSLFPFPCCVLGGDICLTFVALDLYSYKMVMIPFFSPCVCCGINCCVFLRILLIDSGATVFSFWFFNFANDFCTFLLISPLLVVELLV